MNQFPLVPAKAGTPEGLGSRCVGMIGVFDRGSDRPPSRPNEHRLPILFRDEHGPRVIVLLKLSHIRMCLLHTCSRPTSPHDAIS